MPLVTELILVQLIQVEEEKAKDTETQKSQRASTVVFGAQFFKLIMKVVLQKQSDHLKLVLKAGGIGNPQSRTSQNRSSWTHSQLPLTRCPRDPTLRAWSVQSGSFLKHLIIHTHTSKFLQISHVSQQLRGSVFTDQRFGYHFIN